MSPMKRRIVGAWKRLRTPWGCAALLAILIADLLLLGWLVRFDTPVAAFVCRHVYRDFSGRRSDFVDAVQLVRHEGGAYTLIDIAQSADELAALSQNSPERVVTISYWRGRWWVGAWAPWWEREVSTVMIARLSDGKEPGEAREVARARGAFAEWMRVRGRADFAGEIEAGDYNRTRFLWWGPLHDAAMALALLTLASCVPLVPRWWRQRGVRARLARGVCPKCLYDLSRTPITDGVRRCPECGRSWDLAAIT